MAETPRSDLSGSAKPRGLEVSANELAAAGWLLGVELPEGLRDFGVDQATTHGSEQLEGLDALRARRLVTEGDDGSMRPAGLLSEVLACMVTCHISVLVSRVDTESVLTALMCDGGSVVAVEPWGSDQLRIRLQPAEHLLPVIALLTRLHEAAEWTRTSNPVVIEASRSDSSWLDPEVEEALTRALGAKPGVSSVGIAVRTGGGLLPSVAVTWVTDSAGRLLRLKSDQDCIRLVPVSPDGIVDELDRLLRSSM